MIKKFFESTFGIIITLLAVAGAAIWIGNSQWLHDLILKMSGTPVADGAPCITHDNKAGTIRNGVCQLNVGPGGPGGDNPASRAQNAPETLYVSSRGVACAPIYSYMGIDYVLVTRRGNYCYYRKP